MRKCTGLLTLTVILLVALSLPAAASALSSTVSQNGASLWAEASGSRSLSPDVYESAYVSVNGQGYLSVAYQRFDYCDMSLTIGYGSVELSAGQVESGGGSLNTLVVRDVVVPLIGTQGFPTSESSAVVSLTFTGVGKAQTDVFHQALEGYGIQTLARRSRQASVTGSVYLEGIGTIPADIFTSNSLAYASGADVMPPNTDD